MVNTTQVKDGLIVLAVLGVAVGGYLLARKVIDGVGSMGQGIKDAAGAVVDTVTATAATAVQGGTVAPSGQFLPYNNTTSTEQTDWQNEQLRMMAAGNLGA
jgi:hypothetical protein